MIIFLHGDNDYAITRHILKLKSQYGTKYSDSLELISVDAADLNLADLEQTLLAMPMFYTHRLVVVSNLAGLKAYAEALPALIERIPETTVALFDGRGMDRRTALFKVMAKLPQAKEYKPLSNSELNRWLQQEAKRHGASLASAEAMYLVARVGSDQWRLSQEIHKLSSPDASITRNQINELVTPRLEDSVFKLVAAIIQHQLTRALQVYDELILTGSSEPAIIGALSWQFRVFALVLDEASPDDIKSAGMSSYALQRARSEVRTIDKRVVAQALTSLLKADQSIKRGELKPDQAMLGLIVELTR